MDRFGAFIGGLLDINPGIDTDLIERAYKKAAFVHADQERRSGEPYIIHPEEVAKILANLGMDDRTIVAGLLHDTVEDTFYTLEAMTNEFGNDVAQLVDGVTKLDSLVFESKEERQAENLRKMFFAMSEDIRVLIIKLADRLHNLRTINYMNHTQINDKCKETLEIYAPLAGRLGIHTVKSELEDIAFQKLEPEAYDKLMNAVKVKKEEQESIVEKAIEQIGDALSRLNIKCEITGRSKHYYSIYNKMKKQDKGLDEIFDLTAVRIIVETVQDCYATLGAVHELWTPIPDRIKDYIARPKDNLYQSLHTTIIYDNGKPFEVQIRTREMHRIAEYGIAAHWKYKEGGNGDLDESKIASLRETLEQYNDIKDPAEFMDALKVDLFANQVYVFTPKGDVMELPAGSTPLDFAFKIHTDVGAKCVGAKVNGKMVTIDYELSNGEIIDIITSNNSKGPSIDWLKIAKSSNAKSKIRQWLKRQDKSLNVEKGRDVLEKAVKRKGYDPHEVIRVSWVSKAAKNMNYASVEDLYNAASYGGAIVTKIIGNLLEIKDAESAKDARPTDEELIAKASGKNNANRRAEGGNGAVVVKGVDNLLIRLAKCCSPVPGDDIVGFITKGRGVTVHRRDCTNITALPAGDRDRLLDVEWADIGENASYDADIFISANDRKGLFSDISRVCLEMDVNISGVNFKTNPDGTASISLTLTVSGRNQMEKILRNLRQVESVLDVYRARV